MRDAKKSSVAIIILHWASIEDTLELIKSLKDLIYVNYHIFLVDPLVALDKKKLASKRITMLYPGGNLGYSGNNNFALKKVLKLDYDYALLLNNDTIVRPDFLKNLVTVLEENPQAAAAAPTILYYGTKKEIWFAGGELLKNQGAVRHSGLRQSLTDFNEIEPQENSFLTGCCLLLRTAAVKKIGLFDDDYFLYWEDADWCVRAQKMGWQLLYAPSSVIEHKVSKGMGVNSPSYLYYIFRNNLLFIRKYVARRWYWLAWLVLLKKIIKEIIKLFVRYKKDYALYLKMIGRALGDNLKRKYGPL